MENNKKFIVIPYQCEHWAAILHCVDSQEDRRVAIFKANRKKYWVH